jgi:hypothetical protein
MVRHQITRQPEEFAVAFVVTGLRQARHTEPFGCVAVSDPARWPHMEHNDAELTSFVRERLSARRRVFACRVSAYDTDGALVAASERAQVLVDQLTAQGGCGTSRSARPTSSDVWLRPAGTQVASSPKARMPTPSHRASLRRMHDLHVRFATGPLAGTNPRLSWGCCSIGSRWSR